MRVLIAGGLGYDGAGLIESYRDSFKDEIILLDKRFVPHLLCDLPPHFRYVQGDIRDRDLMVSLTRDVDVVYLLAAEVEAEKSINNATIIWENNFEGAKVLIDACSDSTRILFASSGNVFGGILETEKNMELTEEDTPRPKYPYAESKREVEKYLLAGKKNFVVMRFGTHYGFTKGIRFNLVTNIFFKKAMMGENLTVHGDGDNYRPTLCAKDAIRGMRFLADQDDAGGEIFHLVSRNYRIREIAHEVAGAFPGVAVEHVLKDVPFNSYHLRSEKIQKLGFQFNYDVHKAILEMQHVFGVIQQRDGQAREE